MCLSALHFSDCITTCVYCVNYQLMCRLIQHYRANLMLRLNVQIQCNVQGYSFSCIPDKDRGMRMHLYIKKIRADLFVCVWCVWCILINERISHWCIIKVTPYIQVSKLAFYMSLDIQNVWPWAIWLYMHYGVHPLCYGICFWIISTKYPSFRQEAMDWVMCMVFN